MGELIRALVWGGMAWWGLRGGGQRQPAVPVRAVWWTRGEPGPVLPAARSPYGADDGPLDGDAAPLVRPYQRAHEQWQRRLALVLAADFGVDLDTHLVGARSAA
ncbi:hypothetical protein [Streptomyces sp. NPDC093225]|uniref:hypothetical protein n=1 Tax=Streptomyces sp. NPDC093225 TaxID=3366034 RepID=UPI0038088241